MEAKTILIIDDEEHILELLGYNLESAGYRVYRADTGEEGMKILGKEYVDLVVLDLMLPGIDGIEVLKRIRNSKEYPKLPVIMLTAKGDEFSKVIGLELGADDYMAKPFGVHELLARVKAVLRRTEGNLKTVEEEVEERLVFEHLIINKTTRVVEVNGEPIELSLKEFELLYLLAKNKGRVFSRDMLLEKIWGYDFYGETRTVDVHIRNLRKKIEKDDYEPQYIKTVRGVGYKFS